MNPYFGYHEEQQQQQKDENTLISDAIQAEELYFAEYDHAMYLEADYFDQQQDQQYDDEYNDIDDDNEQLDIDEQQQDEDRMDMDSTYDYQNDALLKLIVGVQSYISDLTSVGADRQDSPLLDLQYKMYVYLKQRLSDMGVDANTLI
ncbi:uncharacterized protein BX664DRAFT_324558 [Halteromyces radiatus]|uniref:uncharacterized protein n=1 Tax=Halteromyces radiatus TaxID=101107 RepID=UPI00221E85BD|nr:uncharacterized protein BX664DRAFT_324558 [Halteromyces radiatus]KAI8096660.1 hypothetical protein BX664DRAFT_324558 [Halteromyces radiatus]